MAVMIKLHLPGAGADLASVQNLPGLQGLKLDPDFGLLCISPTRSLYVVRTDQVDRLEERRQQSPEILGAYGDIKISSS